MFHKVLFLAIVFKHFKPEAYFRASLISSSSLCRTLIEKDVSIPPETFRKHVDCSLTHINQALKQMSRLFLVEDLVDSLKVNTQPLLAIIKSLHIEIKVQN